MKLLLDTNVLLDVLLAREPWGANALKLWEAHDQQMFQGYVTATTLTDIFYIVRRASDKTVAIDAVKTCLTTFTVIAVDQPTLELALAKSGYDFEDDLQITCAEIAHVDGIVTRDPKGFVYSTVPIFTLNEAIKQFAV